MNTTFKSTLLAAVTAVTLTAPAVSEARPLNQLVDFSGLNDPSITQTTVPKVTISPGTYATGGQGTISFTTGNFKVGCYATISGGGVPRLIDPAKPPSDCPPIPASIVEYPPLALGYIEFIPQYQNPAYGNPICVIQPDPDPTIAAISSAYPNTIMPGQQQVGWPVQVIEFASIKYFKAADGKMHAGLSFPFIAYPETPYQINFICPPKGP